MDLNPGNKLAHDWYEKCLAECKRKGASEKDLYQGMFDKFKQQDEVLIFSFLSAVTGKRRRRYA